MIRWRIAIGLLLAAIFGIPLALPLADLAADPAGWSAWQGFNRQIVLAQTTARLVGWVVVLTLPVGTLLAVILYRSDLPGRAIFRRLVIVGLFVPLPLFASAWQAVLGSGGWLGPGGEWRPWLTGLGAATWVHVMAALPWVVWLIGQGLCWVERPAEEDALLATTPLQVFWRVTLPRARGAVFAAAAWAALQTANEITVTDTMQVRTFAEEVYTQFVLPDETAGLSPEASLARAVSVALPGVLLMAAFIIGAVLRWERTVPPLATAPEPRPLIHLGHWRWTWLSMIVLFAGTYAGVPIGSLGAKLGQRGATEPWSVVTAEHYVRVAWHAHAALIAESLAVALVVGMLTAGLALVACWLARDSWGYRLGLAALVATAWAMPGPVIGAGLKATIQRLMEVEEWTAGASHGLSWTWLYSGPSWLPVLWADGLRLFPFAVALVWPAVRLVPVGLIDAARVDGASPARELRHVVWPMSFTPVVRATLAVAVLALGELSASKMVATAGGETFAHEVFTRMHYGVANQLAAMCLLLLAMTGVLLIPFRIPFRRDRQRFSPLPALRETRRG